MKKFWYLIGCFLSTAALAQKSPSADSTMLNAIRSEGMTHSQVMDIAFHLTDANGPRLMQSPGYFRAANWAKDKLSSWGLENVRLEPWGKWGRGWELEKFYLALTAPYYRPIIGFPKTFSLPTNGLRHANVILLDLKDSSGLEAYKGKLKDAIVMLKSGDTVSLGWAPDGRRYEDSELTKLEAYDPKAEKPARDTHAVDTYRAMARLIQLTKEFVKSEGALAMLSSGSRNTVGTVFVQNGAIYSPETPETFTDVALSLEDFLTLQRLLQHNIPVQVDLEVATKINESDTQGYNVIGDIKGTDKKLKEQLVMIGGHLDSWQGSTGATDNAAGSAVMLEAIRILKTSGFKPRRTIRIALWGGEETGLHGSKNYVKNHFTDTVTGKFNAEGDKLSVYLNFDNGTGKIRGIYLQGNDAAKPVFEKWFTPFHDWGAKTLTLQNTGGTDHLGFDAIGLPAFQFIQDPMQYGTRTHHSNMDGYDHLSGDDLKQAATIIASFVYNASQQEEKFPRKPFVASKNP